MFGFGYDVWSVMSCLFNWYIMGLIEILMVVSCDVLVMLMRCGV